MCLWFCIDPYQTKIPNDSRTDFPKAFGTISEEEEMTFKRKLMYTNKSPRRIDRKAGARNKKIIKPLYSSPCYLGEIEKQKKKK